MQTSILGEWLAFLGTLLAASNYFVNKSFLESINKRIMSLDGNFFKVDYFKHYDSDGTTNNPPLIIFILIIGALLYSFITSLIPSGILSNSQAFEHLALILFAGSLTAALSVFIIFIFYKFQYWCKSKIPTKQDDFTIFTWIPILLMVPFALAWYLSICIFSVIMYPLIRIHSLSRGDGNIITTLGLVLIIIAFILLRTV